MDGIANVVSAADRQRWQRPSIVVLPVLAELGRAHGVQPLAWRIGSSGGLTGTALRGDRRAVFAHWAAVLGEAYGDALDVRPERVTGDGTRRLTATLAVPTDYGRDVARVLIEADLRDADEWDRCA